MPPPHICGNSSRFSPKAAEPLEAAATHYDREMESLNPLHDLCDTACERQAWHAEDRSEAGKLIGDALEAEREAIASIEAGSLS